MINAKYTLISAIGFTAILALQPLTFSLGFTRLAPFYGVLLFAVRASWPPEPDRKETGSRSNVWLIGFALLFAIIYVTREGIDFAGFSGDSLMGVKMALADVATAGVLFFLLIQVNQQRSDMLEFISIVAIAIGLFVGLNVFLEVTGLMTGDVAEGFQSRYVQGALRWMPPLTKSNGLFSILNRYAAALSLIALIFHWRQLPWAVSLMLAGGLLIEGYAAILLEHRATFLPLAVAPFAHVLANRRHAAVMPLTMFVAMVIVPLVVGTGIWRQGIVRLIPNSVLDLSGDPATVFDLSGREAIYDYGLEYMTGTTMPIMGDGPIYRDSFPGFRDDIRSNIAEDVNRVTAAPITFGFHSGFLDTIIVNGFPLGVIFLLLILGAALSLSRAWDDANMLALTSTHLTVLLTINVVDGGFSDPNILFLTLFGSAFAIRRRHRLAASVGNLAQANTGRLRAAHEARRMCR